MARESRESGDSKIGRRSLLALAGAAFLLPGSTGGIGRAPSAQIPHEYVTDLLGRTAAGHNETDGEYKAGIYIAEANRNGADISAAIMQLEGVHPNLAIGQIYLLLSPPYYGNSLSRKERRAIVYLTNTWPERFEPFYRGENVAVSRSTLVEELRKYPALQRAFATYGRPLPEMVARDERRSTD